MNMSLVPITLVIIFVMAVLGAILMNRKVTKKRNYSYSKRIGAIFAGYLVLLLFSAVLDFAAPYKDRWDWKKVSNPDLQKESDDLYNAAASGKINQINPEFKLKEWKFGYTGRKLEINGEVPNGLVIVERKSVNDDIVSAVYYRTTASMNNLDITNSLKPPRIELTGNVLTFLNPEKTRIEVSDFRAVFPINQFTGKNSFEHSSEFIQGSNLLYIQIPKDLQIDEKKLNIEYVR